MHSTVPLNKKLPNLKCASNAKVMAFRSKDKKLECQYNDVWNADFSEI